MYNESHIHLQVFINFLLDTFYDSGGLQGGTIGDIRGLINLEMPQLNEALSPNKASTQVTASCDVWCFTNCNTVYIFCMLC